MKTSEGKSLLSSEHPVGDMGRNIENVKEDLEVREELNKIADRRPEEGGAKMLTMKNLEIGSAEWQAEIDRVRKLIEEIE